MGRRVNFAYKLPFQDFFFFLIKKTEKKRKKKTLPQGSGA
jgi:hypothetical protein